jgi:hypothetical protein
MLPPLTPEEIAWTESQPVIGSPSLSRLHMILREVGFTPEGLALVDIGEGLELQLLRGGATGALDREQVLRLVIIALRRAGFNIGFSEVAIVEMTDEAVTAFSYVAPLQAIFDLGPPPLIEP